MRERCAAVDLTCCGVQVTGFLTQGRCDGEEWVTAFMVSHSVDGFHWQYVTDIYANQKVVVVAVVVVVLSS